MPVLNSIEVSDTPKINSTTLLLQHTTKKTTGLSTTLWTTLTIVRVASIVLVPSTVLLGTFHKAYVAIILNMTNTVTHNISNNNVSTNSSFAPRACYRIHLKSWHVLWMNVQIKILELKSKWWIMLLSSCGKWIISNQLPIVKWFLMQLGMRRIKYWMDTSKSNLRRLKTHLLNGLLGLIYLNQIVQLMEFLRIRKREDL